MSPNEKGSKTNKNTEIAARLERIIYDSGLSLAEFAQRTGPMLIRCQGAQHDRCPLLTPMSHGKASIVGLAGVTLKLRR